MRLQDNRNYRRESRSVAVIVMTRLQATVTIKEQIVTSIMLRVMMTSIITARKFTEKNHDGSDDDDAAGHGSGTYSSNFPITQLELITVLVVVSRSSSSTPSGSILYCCYIYIFLVLFYFAYIHILYVVDTKQHRHRTNAAQGGAVRGSGAPFLEGSPASGARAGLKARSMYVHIQIQI